MKTFKIGLLPRILIAIVLGVLCGMFFPEWAVRCFVTFNSVFSHFLSFLIPLIIVGLVTPAIADIGKGAGKLLLITAMIAYGDTVFSGYLSYFVSTGIFPMLIDPAKATEAVATAGEIEPFFTIEIPPLLDVMSALISAFVMGLGISFFESPTLKKCFDEFRDIVAKTIEVALIPILPLYIFSIFLNMSFTGQAWHIINVFITIIGVIFVMHIFLLVFQYCIAGAISRRNPFRALYNMLPAYFTALGTSSSAATIPVTLKQAKKNGVSEGIAGFVVPLCATIHLSGSAMKITACAVALLLMQGGNIDIGLFTGFILMLGVMMVAAPGVPGGAIMAALAVLQSILGFTPDQQAVMIALYITMDSFGTACNVTGDGAIALVIDRIYNRADAQRETDA
ncbi:MAG: dicarboxylate/amino acid:cation symporter [Muribaculaceae bacterium]|nr:dicarboxylate/amino acid:cation symporter [Muribaculaceae bacterium]